MTIRDIANEENENDEDDEPADEPEVQIAERTIVAVEFESELPDREDKRGTKIGKEGASTVAFKYPIIKSDIFLCPHEHQVQIENRNPENQAEIICKEKKSDKYLLRPINLLNVDEEKSFVNFSQCTVFSLAKCSHKPVSASFTHTYLV